MEASLSKEEQHRLIEEHVGYCRAIAAKVKQSLHSPQIDLDELAAFGSKGLVEAAQRFDPTRGVAFTTYSYYRIRGAIYDGLRQTGWLSRSQYARFSAAANNYLGNRAEREHTGPSATAETKAGALNDIAETLRDLAAIFVTSYSAEGHPEPADQQTPDGCEALESKELAQTVRAAVESLPQKERDLVGYYYYEGLSLNEAGKRLGLSTSWSSRLHARAIRLLARRLRHLDG